MRPHRLGLPQDRTSEPNWLVRKFRGRIRVLALEAGQDLNQSLARFFPLMRRSASSVGIQARYGTGVSRAGEPAGSLSLADTQKNEALALAEFAAGALHLQSTPPTMTVESSSWCNLRCVMCPHAINAVHRPKHIEPELVQSLEKYIRQARSIQLHGIGEPFASPAFWYNLSILSDDCHSEVNTNFTLLDEQKLRQLLDSKL